MSSSKTYRLFGLNLRSDFCFGSHLQLGSGAVDLEFTCRRDARRLADWERAKCVWASQALATDRISSVSLHHLPDCDALRFGGLFDFYLTRERIECHLSDSAYDYLVELRLLGPVLSFWLEQQGIPVLHASAVSKGSQAIGFLSSNSGGKSTLTATLMESGLLLLTDDVLAVEPNRERVVARPGYPQMRMWPRDAQHFLGCYEDLALVHPAYSKRRVYVGPGGFGEFCSEPRQLSCLYLPQRYDAAGGTTRISIVPVFPRDAVLELVRHSFTPRLIEASGFQLARLAFFASLARLVPVRRVIYPSGLQHLPAVCDALLSDMSRLAIEA